MQASQQTFSKIIQSDNAYEHYHIPKFQRAYSWGLGNWESLYDDINDNEPGHFLGSIICINENKNHIPGNEIIFELIDGQQRLTTLSLLLAAIHYWLNAHIEELVDDDDDEDEIDELKAKKRGIAKQLLKKKKKASKEEIGCVKADGKIAFFRVQPSTQDHNLADYRYILHDCGVIKKAPVKESYFGNRRMSKAYEYFYDRLPDNLDDIENLIQKINQLMLVFISVDSHSNAFKLFETLNNRGVPLTAIDIIKNKILAEMEKQKNVSVDESYELWQELLDMIPDGNQDRFLRQFYNAFKHKKNIFVKKHPGKATSSALITIYESLINKDSKAIFDELIDKAEIYNQLIAPDGEDELSQEIVELNRISAAPAYTLLLYLLSLDDDSFEEDESIVSIVQLLQKYYLRRNITNVPGTRDLDQINIDLVSVCEATLSKKKKIGVELIENELLSGRAEPAGLSDFREHLEDNLFAYNSWMTRYLLIKIDEQAHSREYAPDLWKRNQKGQYVWTVEHVFPQGKNIPNEWVDMVADGDKDKAVKIQEEWVHCLGNLTLSGYNSRLSNHSFPKKQSKSSMTALGQKISIGYKNGLYLNKLPFQLDGEEQSLATIPSWNEQCIEARNNAIIENVCRAYCFDHEMSEVEEMWDDED